MNRIVSEPKVIFMGDTAWCLGVMRDGQAQVVDLPMLNAEPPDVRRDAAAHAGSEIAIFLQTLRKHGWREHRPLVLAVASNACMSASIRCDDLPRRQRRSSMLYRFEEALPLPIEDVTVDFHVGRRETLAVALETDRVKAVVVSLEAAGIRIAHIVPSAMLSLQALLARGGAPMPNAVLLGAEGRHDLFIVADGCPRSWRWLAADRDEVRLQIEMAGLSVSQRLRLTTMGLSSSIAESLCNDANVDSHDCNERPHAMAVPLAERILAGRAMPWIDFRRDRLAAADPHERLRVPVQAALTAAMILFACVIVVLHWRASQYEQVSARCESEQREVYRQVFPLGQAPQNPKLRLMSQQRALRGSRGDNSELPPQTSALAVLREALVRVPSDVRFRLLEIRIEGDRLYLDGQARNHSDADAVCAALRARQVFAVEPPRTEQLRDTQGVAFTITGKAPLPANTDASLAPSGTLPVEARRER